MIEINDIAILIVLYKEHPPVYVNDNIGCNIIIVDNTPNRTLKVEGGNLTYVPLMRNMGIAYALNAGMKKAISMGKQWVITMDQDSALPGNMITSYIDYLNGSIEKVGVVSPLINMYDGEDKNPSNTVLIVDEALTSGSMVNTRIYEEVGGFKDEMFIDVVDFEFCWNIRRHGYKVVHLNSVVMQHHLGNTVEYSLKKKHLFYVTNHSPLRRYYMTRNMLYLHKMYPEFRPSKVKSLYMWVIGICKILLFESKSLSKLKAGYLGYKDYRRNIMGECRYSL